MTITRVDKKYDVVISGMGPAGLAAAWVALQQNKRVLMISDRDEKFRRVQRVLLTPESVNFLLSMLGDYDFHTLNKKDQIFIQELFESSSVAIKDIEEFIKNRLDEFPKDQVFFVYNSEISKINFEEGSASLKSDELKTCQFDYLVAADGARHHAVDVFNKDREDKKEEKIIYEKGASPEVKNHMSLYLTIEAKGELVLPKEKNGLVTTDVSGNFLCFIALDLHSYEKSNHKKVKCSISAELPPSMANATRDEMIEYIRPIIVDYFKKNAPENKILNIEIVRKDKLNDPKEKLKSQPFVVNVMKANKFAVEDKKNKKNIFLMGDTVRSAVYHHGHGVNDAFQHAQWFGKVLTGKMTAKEYNDACKTRIYQIAKKAAFLNSMTKTDFANFIETKVQIGLKAKKVYLHLKDKLLILRDKIIDKVGPSSEELESCYKIYQLLESMYQIPEKFLDEQKNIAQKIDTLEKELNSLKSFRKTK